MGINNVEILDNIESPSIQNKKIKKRDRSHIIGNWVVKKFGKHLSTAHQDGKTPTHLKAKQALECTHAAH
jgi:hypothetical protein